MSETEFVNVKILKEYYDGERKIVAASSQVNRFRITLILFKGNAI